MIFAKTYCVLGLRVRKTCPMSKIGSRGHEVQYLFEGSLMSLNINICLPNGHFDTLSVSPSSKVGDLRNLAQKSLQRGFLRLVTREGHFLADPVQSLQNVGLQDGDTINAFAQEPELAETGGAFALWCCGGDRIVTWGNAKFGGDSSAVQDRFRSVQQLEATSFAFAAILADRSVVTWGNPANGGDSSAMRDQLKGVVQVQAAHQAFAAILTDGSVVTWGAPRFGGDSSKVQDLLRNVQQLAATMHAFAAILENGSIVTWGDPKTGGDSSAVQHQLINVQQIRATHQAFAAILAEFCCDMGQSCKWWRQLCNAGSAERCGTGSGRTPSICCDPNRWICGYMGCPTFWRRQLCSAGSSKKCAAACGHNVCICCDPGKWVRCDMGRSNNRW